MEKKTIYVVIRIDRWVEFKTKMADVHIYSNQSSNRDRIVEYAKQIKKPIPTDRSQQLVEKKQKNYIKNVVNFTKKKKK